MTMHGNYHDPGWGWVVMLVFLLVLIAITVIGTVLAIQAFQRRPQATPRRSDAEGWPRPARVTAARYRQERARLGHNARRGRRTW